MPQTTSHHETLPTDPQSARRTLLALAVVAGLAFAFGWPTRHGEFLMGDDQRFVTEHVLVNHPSLQHAWELLKSVHGDLWQPLPMLSFQMNYAMASAEAASRFKISSYGFHLTNIMLHTANTVLACLIALRVSRRLAIGFLTGAMFACHPFALEPVAWISGRMILLATLFAFVMILVCLHRREDGRGSWPWWAGLAWVFSLLSKVLPSVPIAAAWCDYGRLRRVRRRAWIGYAILLALAMIASAPALETTRQAGFAQEIESEFETSMPVRLLLGGQYYLENYVWPSKLSPWSPPPNGVRFGSRPTVQAVIVIGAFLVFAVLAWRYSRTAFVGLVLFAILIAPFLATTAMRRLLAADRYMYLPGLGLHLALAAALVQLSDWLARRSSYATARSLLVAPVVLVGIWLWIGWNLAPVWNDSIRFAERIVAIYPDDALAYNELAKAHLYEREPDRALEVVARARARWPTHPRLAAQAGEAYIMKKEWARAEKELRQASAQMPNHLRTQYNYAVTLDRLGRAAEAREHYQRILGVHVDHLPTTVALAKSYASSGEIGPAIDTYEQAIGINAFHRESLFELSLLRIRQQEYSKAETLLCAILTIDPADRSAEFHLAVVLFQQGKGESALAIYDRLLEDDPANVNIQLNRAYALAGMKQWKKAEAAYRRILKSQPEHLDASLCMHELLQKQERYSELLSVWMNYERATGTPEARAYLAWAYALNDQSTQAEHIIVSIPEAAPEREFAEWVLTYDALRSESYDDLAIALGQPVVKSGHNPQRQQQARVIIPAFAMLPSTIRSSTAGQYTLARFLVFSGDLANAGNTLRQLAEFTEKDRWTAAGKDLLRLIDSVIGE